MQSGYRQDAERFRQDAERQKRQSALLRELKSFAALQKYVEKTEADRGGVERTDRPSGSD
jgi:hypothetical protein